MKYVSIKIQTEVVDKVCFTSYRENFSKDEFYLKYILPKKFGVLLSKVKHWTHNRCLGIEKSQIQK